MMDINKLIEKFGSNKDKGLTNEAASDAFTKYGENSLTDKTAVPWYIIFLHELTSLFNLLLIGAGTLCLIAYGLQPEGNINNTYLAAVLYAVVLITAILSFA
jgi:sodium/potassium-transporting ATPase subunit alpha